MKVSALANEDTCNIKIKIPATDIAGIFILYANNKLIIRYYSFAMIASTAALRPSGFLPPAVAKWG